MFESTAGISSGSESVLVDLNVTPFSPGAEAGVEELLTALLLVVVGVVVLTSDPSSTTFAFLVDVDGGNGDFVEADDDFLAPEAADVEAAADEVVGAGDFPRELLVACCRTTTLPSAASTPFFAGRPRFFVVATSADMLDLLCVTSLISCIQRRIFWKEKL